MKRSNVLFKNRREAGILLSNKLKKCKNQKVVAYAIPRGGVITAFEIAESLNAPLDLIITKKIGHPRNPEYAISAISESGKLIKTDEIKLVDSAWLQNESRKQKQEIVRRKEIYLKGRKNVSGKGKIVILVDDGIATGFTIRAAIEELKQKKPSKIIIATPVISKSTKELIEKEVDEIVILKTISNKAFRSIGSFYEDFSQVSDEEVIEVLKKLDSKALISL